MAADAWGVSWAGAPGIWGVSWGPGTPSSTVTLPVYGPPFLTMLSPIFTTLTRQSEVVTTITRRAEIDEDS